MNFNDFSFVFYCREPRRWNCGLKYSNTFVEKLRTILYANTLFNNIIVPVYKRDFQIFRIDRVKNNL